MVGPTCAFTLQNLKNWWGPGPPGPLGDATPALVVAAPIPGSILHHPGARGGVGWSWGRCGCHKDPCQTELQFCRVPHMGGIKLQLLCGVRIELAVGSLPYPGKSGFPIVSPGRDRPLSGFPICKPCLDVRQNPSRNTHFPSYERRPLPKPRKPKIPFNYACDY